MIRPCSTFGSIALVASTGCALAAATTAAQADWSPVSGRVLSQLVPGSTVIIDAPMGFKLPIQHADDGSMTGEAGGLSFYLGSSTDTGQWWVTSDKLCYKWARWFKSESRCMRIRRDGNRIEWEKDDGETGTASMTLRKSPPAEHVADAAAAPPRPIAQLAPRLAAVEPNGPPVQLAKPPATPSPPATAAKAATTSSASVKAISPKAPAAATGLAAASVRTASMAPLRAPAAPAPTSNPSAFGPRIAMQPAGVPPYRVGGPPPPAYRVVSVAYDDVLNVRQGPSAEHPAIAALDPEARGVRLIGPCQGEWCFVRHQEIVGWVNRFYLEEIPSR